MNFSELKKPINLYAGDIPYWRNDGIIGVSLSRSDSRHISHDITNRFDLLDCCVETLQAESVFDWIEMDKASIVIDEIYRILVIGGLFRFSVADYRSPILYNRSLKSDGKFYKDTADCNVKWFATIETVRLVLEKTKFKNINYLHYYSEEGIPITNKIDHSLGMIQRTPDFDKRVTASGLPLSIVVDLWK